MTEYLSSYDYELIADALDVLDPDGSEATSRKQELEAWARSMAASGRGYLPAFVPAIVGAGDELAAIVSDALETHIYEPGETPDDAPELAAIAAWEAAKQGEGEPAPIRVVAALEGGIIQGAVADRRGVVLLTVDYDTDGETDDVFAIPQDDGTTAEGFRGEIEPEINPAWIDALQAAAPVDGDDDECGQCEGTGTTDAMGEAEECPVCDGNGQLAGA